MEIDVVDELLGQAFVPARLQDVANSCSAILQSTARAADEIKRLRSDLRNSQNKLKESGRAKLREEVSRLRKDVSGMRQALQVIESWAQFDAEPLAGYRIIALEPNAVIELCRKAAGTSDA